MVRRNFQSLNVPDPRTVTEEYAFILKVVDGSGPLREDDEVAIAAEEECGSGDGIAEYDGMMECGEDDGDG